eukprot:6149830-Pyramimonas_sp.AAC.1
MHTSKAVISKLPNIAQKMIAFIFGCCVCMTIFNMPHIGTRCKYWRCPCCPSSPLSFHAGERGIAGNGGLHNYVP